MNILRKKINSIELKYKRQKLELYFPFLKECNQKKQEFISNCELQKKYNFYVQNISTPDMAISFETAIFLKEICHNLQPQKILDLGSGFTSFLLRYYAKTQQSIPDVYSIDNQAKWLEKTKLFFIRI